MLRRTRRELPQKDPTMSNLYAPGNSFTVDLYVPSGSIHTLHGNLAVILNLLLEHPEGLTRLEILEKSTPAAAFVAGLTIRRLRRRGVPIETTMETGKNTYRGDVKFARYRLAGPVRLCDRYVVTAAREVISLGPWPATS
jgi:hypothetical protein